jgi:hypothetical protein
MHPTAINTPGTLFRGTSLTAAESDEIVGHGVKTSMDDLIIHGEEKNLVKVLTHQGL